MFSSSHIYHGSKAIKRSYYDCIYIRNTLYVYDIEEMKQDLNAWSLMPYC